MSRISSLLSKFQTSAVNSVSGNEKKLEKKVTGNDETTSVVSEISGTDFTTSVVSDWKNMLNYSLDSNIDEYMKNLYIDPDILERNCMLSAKGELSSLDTNTNDYAKFSMKKFAINKTTNSVVTGLPENYFKADFDPVKAILLEVSKWRIEDISVNFMTKIEEFDTDKDFVVSKLTDAIESNYHELNGCLNDVYVINTDLLKAEIQISTARRHLTIAKNKLEKGALKLSQLQNQKDNHILIRETLKSLQNMKSLYKLMGNNLTVGDFSRAADSACSVLNVFREGTYSKFHALQQVATDIQTNLVFLRQKLDKALNRLCNSKFTSIEYESVIYAYTHVDYINEVLGYETTEYMSYVSSTPDALGCIIGLPRRILFNMFEDVQISVRNAILETICDSNIQKQHVSLITGVPQHDDLNELSELSEMENNDLLEKITPDLVVPFVCRSCEKLSEIIYTKFLINQWHMTPFDSRNSDLKFLTNNKSEYSSFIKPSHSTHNSERGHENHSHVSNTIINDKKIEIQQGLDTNPVENINITSQSRQNKILSYSDFRLNVVYNKLIQTNISLWDEIDETLQEILNAVNISSAIPFEDYMSMIWAINVMISLGYEFCESESLTLLNILNKKTREYFNRQHLESYNVLRQMIENESWLHIPVNLTDLGGISGLIRKHLINKQDSNVGVRSMMGLTLSRGIVDSVVYVTGTRSCVPTTDSSSEQLTAQTVSSNDTEHFNNNSDNNSLNGHNHKQKSILEMFILHGNPFLFNAESSDVINNVEQHKVVENVNKAKAIKDIFVSIFDEENDINTEHNITKRDELTSAVVTQTVMNGIVKYTAKYIQFMYLMPSASGDAFRGLCALFDYYICAVFITFITNDDRMKLLSKPTKMSLSSPDQLRDFEQLKIYIERALNETVPTEYSPIDENNTPIDNINTDEASLPINVIFSPESEQNQITADSDDDNSVVGDTNHTSNADKTVSTAADVINALVPSENSVSEKSPLSKSNTTATTHDSNSNSNSNSTNNTEVMSSSAASALYVSSSFRQASSSVYSATKSGLSFAGKSITQAPTSFNFPKSASLHIPLPPIRDITNSISSSSASVGAAMADSLGNVNSVINISQASGINQNNNISTSSSENNFKVSSFLSTTSDTVKNANYDSASMYGLDLKVVAAESCWLASAILVEIKQKLLKLLPETQVSKDTVELYIENYRTVAGQIRCLIYRTMSPMITKSKTTLTQILDSSNGWDTKKTRNDPHDWVSNMTQNCKAVWTYLNNEVKTKFAEAGSVVIEQVWFEICQCQFDVILEAVSRIKKISNEGRANIILDIKCLQDNLDMIHPCKPPKGLLYVEEYINATALQNDSLLNWIQNNWQSYTYRHIYNLLHVVFKSSVLSSMSSMTTNKKFSEALSILDELYVNIETDFEYDKEGGKLSSLISNITNRNGMST